MFIYIIHKSNITLFISTVNNEKTSNQKLNYNQHISKLVKRIRSKLVKLDKNLNQNFHNQNVHPLSKDLNLCFARVSALIVSESLLIGLLAWIKEVEANSKTQFNKMKYLNILHHVGWDLQNEIDWMKFLLKQSNRHKFMTKIRLILNDFKQSLRLFNSQGLVLWNKFIGNDESFFLRKCKLES